MDKYNKHMNLEDRKKIQDFLNAWYTEGITFSQIALNLEKDATTISKEIKKHREKLKPSSFNNGFNRFKLDKSKSWWINCPMNAPNKVSPAPVVSIIFSLIASILI